MPPGDADYITATPPQREYQYWLKATRRQRAALHRRHLPASSHVRSRYQALFCRLFTLFCEGLGVNMLMP